MRKGCESEPRPAFDIPTHVGRQKVWISNVGGGKVAPVMKQAWKTCVRILIGLTVASLTIWYTVFRLLDKGHPLETINLWLIAIAIICLVLLAYPEIFSRLQRIEVAGVTIELLEKRQDEQQAQLDEFMLILPIILPTNERKHLLNLASGNTKNYIGNSNVQTEIRRLRSIGLISNTQPIGYIKDGVPFDLSSFVQLTRFGRSGYPNS